MATLAPLRNTHRPRRNNHTGVQTTRTRRTTALCMRNLQPVHQDYLRSISLVTSRDRMRRLLLRLHSMPSMGRLLVV